MKRKILKVLSYVLVALISIAATLAVILILPAEEDSKLQQVEELIEGYFIEDADMEAVRDAAADAMIESLGDRWSYYMTAQEYQSYKEQMANSYVGIGVTVELDADGRGAKITQVTAGGGAEEVGILAGDIIVAVEGTSCEGLVLNDISAMVKGTENSYVNLSILRGEEILELTVQRRRIETVVATGVMLEDNIGLVTIENFDSRCYDETVAAIKDLLDQGAEKLIFDVRYNPGGYKTQLVDVLDYLLPEGILFQSEYYDGTTYSDRSDAKCLEIPMAVLVNGSSYSAAEFFAAALSEYEWATVVGTQTCGKGYFQKSFELSDGSAVNLSYGKYYTPLGNSLIGVGITPDVVVEVDDETAAAIYAGTLDPMEDPQILAAIEALKAE